MCRAAVGSSWKSGPRKAEGQKAGGAAGTLWDLGQILEPQALPASERRAPFRHVTPRSESILWRARPPGCASCSLRDARFQLSSPWSEPTFDRWVELTVSQDWRPPANDLPRSPRPRRPSVSNPLHTVKQSEQVSYRRHLSPWRNHTSGCLGGACDAGRERCPGDEGFSSVEPGGEAGTVRLGAVG